MFVIPLYDIAYIFAQTLALYDYIIMFLIFPVSKNKLNLCWFLAKKSGPGPTGLSTGLLRAEKLAFPKALHRLWEAVNNQEMGRFRESERASKTNAGVLEDPDLPVRIPEFWLDSVC